MASIKSITILCISFPLFVSCNKGMRSGKAQEKLPGTWQAQPITIDGDSKDWPSPYPNYDAKAMVAYATSNDKQTLYVTVETGDELTQIKILKRGMTVSIDTTGGKEASFHINYPLPNDQDLSEMLVQQEGIKQRGGMQLGRQYQKVFKRSVDEATQLTVEGFRDCAGGYLASQTLPCGIKVRMMVDEYKQLIWEAAIPFKAIYGRDISAADAGRPISVCFAVKGFKNPEATKGGTDNSAGMNNNGLGAAGMGTGGRPNSMPVGGGGLRGNTENPMQRLYESSKTWKYFGIAYQ